MIATTIEGIIEKNETLLQEEINRIDVRRRYLSLSADEYKKLMNLKAKQISAKRNIIAEFIVDDNNKEVLNQLYYYLTKSSKFKGDFKKGIILTGNIGTGKTLILRAYCEMIEDSTNFVINFMKAKDLSAKILEVGVEHCASRIILIDDIGKEEAIINDFGTKTTPIKDLLDARYEIGSWTFATANYKLETFEEKYGKMIYDRMKEMFNILELKGKSRRK